MKRLGEKALILGLAGELACLPFGLWEASKTNERVEELRAANNELGKLGWSRSMRLYHGKFATLIKQKPKGELFIFSEPDNPEAVSFGVTLRIIMMDAGWATHGPIPWEAKKLDEFVPGTTYLKRAWLIEAAEMNMELNGVIIPIGHGVLFDGLCDSLDRAGFSRTIFWDSPPLPTNRVVLLIGKR